MRRARRRQVIAFWLPWLLMTIVVTGTYIECYRVVRRRSADRFTGSQGRALEKRVQALEKNINDNYVSGRSQDGTNDGNP